MPVLGQCEDKRWIGEEPKELLPLWLTPIALPNRYPPTPQLRAMEQPLQRGRSAVARNGLKGYDDGRTVVFDQLQTIRCHDAARYARDALDGCRRERDARG